MHYCVQFPHDNSEGMDVIVASLVAGKFTISLC